MDPNSSHQTWGQWTFTLQVRGRPVDGLFFETVRLQSAGFFRRLFGSAGQMRLDARLLTVTAPRVSEWVVSVQAEGRPIMDPGYRAAVQGAVGAFFDRGFNQPTHLHMEASLLAGKPEDGRPAAQWLMLPAIAPTSVAWSQ